MISYLSMLSSWFQPLQRLQILIIKGQLGVPLAVMVSLVPFD